MEQILQQLAIIQNWITQVNTMLKTIIDFDELTDAQATDYLTVMRAGVNKKLAIGKILEAVSGTQPKMIDGYIVDTSANTDKEAIEATNIIIGEFSAGRFIVAKVNALPYSTESNLTLFVDTGGSI